jgi:V8-like Glu-specific endopeptidase
MRAPWPEEDAELAVIGPSDGRVQELNTSRFPWNTVVHLCRDFGSGGCAGCSGILIAPLKVLTAAHCLWSLKRKAAPRRIFVIAGRRDRATMPYGAIGAQRYWVPQGFLRGPDRTAWDWGVIELPRPFARIERFVPMRALADAELARLARAARVSVAGYPSDRPVGTMWRHNERLVRATAQRLFHTVDTCPGHSGSAILARLGPAPAIIGVHTAGLLDAEGQSHGCKPGSVMAPPGAVNSGIRLTPDILAALRDPAAPRSGAARMVRLP